MGAVGSNKLNRPVVWRLHDDHGSDFLCALLVLISTKLPRTLASTHTPVSLLSASVVISKSNRCALSDRHQTSIADVRVTSSRRTTNCLHLHRPRLISIIEP